LVFLCLVSPVMSAGAADSAELLPDRDGGNVGWRPSAGAVHSTLVADAACDGSATYNHTTSTKARDSYRLPLASIPDGAVITGLTITPCASRHSTGSGTPTLRLFHRWSGGARSADYGDYRLTDPSNVPADQAPTVVSGLSLVKSPTSVLEIGVVYGANAGNVRGIRVSRLAAVLAYAPLEAPTNLLAVPGNGAVQLAWQDRTSAESGFRVERSANGTTFGLVANLPADATAFTETGVPNGTYHYRVRAFNAGAATGWSNIAQVTVGAVSIGSAMAVAGDGQAATAGTILPIAPAVIVRDTTGVPMSGVPVRFEVVSGGGSVSGGNAISGSDGVATAGPWTLGAVPGPNGLAARVTGLSDVVFGATGTAIPMGNLVPGTGVNDQSAPVSTPVAVPVTVTVRSAAGLPQAGVAVSFMVTGGGGVVQNATAVSGANGVASAGAWTLGSVAGAQGLQVTAPGFAPITIQATATATGTPTVARSVVLAGLANPWDIAFAADGAMFFSERSRGLSVRMPDGTTRLVHRPDDLATGEQCGMNGIALDPDFAANRTLYAFVSVTVGPAIESRVVAFELTAGYAGIAGRRDVITGIPYYNGLHCGGRVRFGPDGFLYVTTGDNHHGVRPQAVSSLSGKVLRVDRDGVAAPGNNGITGADPRVFTYGHRNPQGIAFRPGTGQPYTSEHGPGYADEVTPLAAGGNGGWDPFCAEGSPWGVQYCGYSGAVPMTDVSRFPAAMIPAWTTGNDSEGMAGSTFISGAQWRDWNGAIVVAFLSGRRLEVIRLNAAGSVGTSAPLFAGQGVRLRSVVQAPDGSVYVTTDNKAGGDEIWRLVPE